MSLPDFVIGGAPKCGTTALFHYLGQHPEVFTTTPKEPHYFASAPLGRPIVKGDYSRAEYEVLFAGCRPGQVAGEGSTHYLHYAADVAPALAAAVPDVRLLFLLRDPVERAYSHYWFRYSTAGPWTVGGVGSGLSFVEFARHPEVFRIGDYAANLVPFYEYFDREQVLVLLTEDLRRAPSGVMRRVCEHIGVDPSFAFDLSSKKNSTGYPRYPALMPAADWVALAGLRLAAPLGRGDQVIQMRRRWLFSPQAPKPPMPPEDRAKVAVWYRPGVERLAGLIERDLSHWKRSSSLV